MTTTQMTKRDSYIPGWHHEETIGNGDTGNDIKIFPVPDDKRITCTIIAGANTGKFQVTTSTDAKVAAGTATWQDWAKGVTTGTVSDVLIGPVTAIRGVSASGEIEIEVVI
jgi:hypothetical protein